MPALGPTWGATEDLAAPTAVGAGADLLRAAAICVSASRPRSPSFDDNVTFAYGNPSLARDAREHAEMDAAEGAAWSSTVRLPGRHYGEADDDRQA